MKGSHARWLKRHQQSENKRCSSSNYTHLYEQALDAAVGSTKAARSLATHEVDSTTAEVPANINLKVGQMYFMKCPDNPKFIRTVFLKYNPYTNNPQALVSNPVYAEAPEGATEVSAQTVLKYMKPGNVETMNAFVRTTQQDMLNAKFNEWKSVNPSAQ